MEKETLKEFEKFSERIMAVDIENATLENFLQALTDFTALLAKATVENHLEIKKLKEKN